MKIITYSLATTALAAVALFAAGVPAATTGPITVDANIFVNLAKKTVPSVVNISTLSTVRRGYGGGMGGQEDLFRQFFEDFLRRRGGDRDRGSEDEEEGEDGGNRERGGRGGPKAMALGTGFIIDASGLILTNNHVVAGADEIKIHFTESTDEKPTDGEVVGRDPEIDIALIKVKTKRELIPLVFGDSDALEVGEYVVAVGNPFGQGHSVTHGIISAKGRLAPDFPLASYLQTDAPINPGNSGGPLVNLKGEVIGINNAIEARAQGIGFAIPINAIKKILPQLRTKGTVSRGYIGVLVNELTPEIATKIGVSKDLRAPFVTHAYPGEPADKAGLQTYDVILSLNGKTVKSAADLIAAVTSLSVGESVPVKVLRGKEEKTLTIKVSQRPSTLPGEPSRDPKKKEKKPTRVETGMELETVTPDIAREVGLSEKTTGVVVSSIAFGGPADRAGLARGDVIVEADRKPLKNVDDFFSMVKEKKAYLLRVRRPDPQGRDVFSVILLDLTAK